MTEIILTPAEIEKIKLDREEAEMKKSKQINEFNLKVEDIVKRAEEKIQKELLLQKRKNEFIIAEFQKIDSKFFELYALKSSISYRGYREKTFGNHLKTEENEYGEFVAFERNVEFESISIVRKEDKRFEIIALFETIGNRKYGGSIAKIDFCLKRGDHLVIDGPDRKYKNINKLIERFEEKIEAEKRQNNYKKEREEVNEKIKGFLESKFPDASVSVSEVYKRSSGGNFYNVLEKKITLKNGIVIEFSEERGEMLSIKKIDGNINKVNPDALINFLLALDTSEITQTMSFKK